MFNPSTRTWSKPLYIENVAGQHYVTYCSLSSGQILLARGNPGPGLATTWNLYVSNFARTQFSSVVTHSLGAIDGVWYSNTGTAVYVSVGRWPTTLLAASDSNIDGSAWTAGGIGL
jgi:hypothetical protein